MKQCIICQGKSLGLIQKGLFDDPKRDIVQCLKCKMVFMDPMMAEAEISAYYSNYEAHIAERVKNKKSLKEMQQLVVSAAKRQSETFQDFLHKTSRLLDIGAAEGSFLIEAKKFVKSVTAVEPNLIDRKRLDKLGINNYSWLNEIDSKKAKFNIISLFHTLEHFNDPLAVILDIRHYLLPKGLIFIEVPNLDEILISKYKNEAYTKFSFQLQHSSYFTHETLATLFKKAGFKVVKQSYAQRYGISNHLTWLTTGKPGGNKDLEKIMAPVDDLYRKTLINNGYADTLMAAFEME